MEISREEFMQASWDARLELMPEELEGLEKQTKNIFEQATFLQSSALDDVEATYFPLAQKNTVREDLAAPSLPLETALSNAPGAESPYIQVPKIVE
ncbi:MAG: Asp-tRNA(Asn)/Glu-tRNA(Gln) amidotransferase subunit GatC [Firmicutes bacterium]|nr:Asp-tRNA(Asn)/Glu-tRNA(Gln) amidotransferase subunit GatC [Bacillota bacterium]